LYSRISPEGIREKPRAFLSISGKPSLIETADEGILVLGGTEVGEDGRAITFDRPGARQMPVPARKAPDEEVKKGQKTDEEDDD
jgi:hypothetical protein